MSNLEKKVDALMRLVTSVDGPAYDKAMVEVLTLMKGPSAPADDLTVEDAVLETLKTFGVPENIRGYDYLVTTLTAAVKDKWLTKAVTKQLYPIAAKEHNGSVRSVERGIRHAIERIWLCCDMDILQEYFGNTVSALKGRPTNAEFIARVSNVIRRRMREVS